ncbi:MAG TPA: cysteine--tRNA ligase [Cellvibrionaceae bacterium]|nr:cysteine--tRNA ligase [Cellvibrionaceae bacterium]
MQFSLYNTLSGEKELFKPLVAGKIGMYVCGITVYDFCHIGHARVMVVFDVITRYLRARGWDLTYVRNITDIDDKIIQRAAENGESIDALTERFIAAMVEDETALGVLRPDQEPKATEHVAGIIDLIKLLEEKQFAYAASNGDVYYRVAKFADYGKLTNKKLDELEIGKRIAIEEAKEDPRDFVLWKAAKAGEVSWPSPWGNGRPGWHIECSAMSKSCLGLTLDIHGGGPDLPFPHHENEIAQSEAANGCQYAHYWMHAGAVRVNDEKMSKSLGNFFTIRDVLSRYHPEVVRYLLLSSHYRSSINYSEESLKEARSALERFYGCLKQFGDLPVLPLAEAFASEPGQAFCAAMDDDFNTRVALSVLFDLVRQINSSPDAHSAAVLKTLGSILGVLQAAPEAFLQAGSTALDVAKIEALIHERAEAKGAKDFARCDEIRLELKAMGVVLEDSRSGTTWRAEV